MERCLGFHRAPGRRIHPDEPGIDVGKREDTTGAPAVYAGPDQLVEARRATGGAAAEAGFLTQGTKQLKEGTDQLKDGSGELAEAVRSASDGADQLSKGMVEIQAGTGQLADSHPRR